MITTISLLVFLLFLHAEVFVVDALPRFPLRNSRFFRMNRIALSSSQAHEDSHIDPSLLELRQAVSRLGDRSHNDLSVIACWDESMNNLVEHYNQVFPSRCTSYTSKIQFEAEQQLVLSECKARMQLLLQEVGDVEVSYESYLVELKADLSDLIGKIEFQDTSTAVVKKSRWDIWRNSKWFQRSKWVAAQALMLLYNFGQYEVHRRLTKRAAEKRLAEHTNISKSSSSSQKDSPTMLPSKVSTPVFAKSSSSRRIGEYQAGSGKARRNSGQAHKTLEEANLRIVQYEIAEREACKVISSMCAEAAKRLDIVDTEYEIDDILSGILVLGNLYKRVGNEKVTLEGTIVGMKNEYTTLESEKNCMIDRLETAILRLQMENNKLQENMTEMKLKHNHKLIIAMKEIHEHQEQSELLKNEKAQLETKLQYQERRLMEVPRMEEQYQRNARGIVRQQEVANTLKEIGWKKLEGEVKSMNFWKSKAKSLEETVSRQKAELDNLNAQGRLNLSRYQSLLLSYQTLKRSHPHDDFTMHNVMVSNRPGTAGTGRSTTGTAGEDDTAKRNRRPGSAPASRAPTHTSSSNTDPNNHNNVHTSDAELPLPGAQSDATFTEEAAKAARDIHTVQHHMHDRRGTEHHRPRHNIFKKTLHHISAEELEKLRDIIAAKDVLITKLSRKLSHARAYPLKGINVPDMDSCSEYEDYEITANNGTGNGAQHQQQAQRQQQNFKNTGNTRTATSAKYSTLSTAFADEDNASESESFVAAEDAHQQRRVEKALEIQQMYNERAAKTKASNPPHIRAIREAKSFSESVTKNVRRPQSAY